MKIRVRIREVGETERLLELGQHPCYSVFLSEGVAASCDGANSPLLEKLFQKLGTSDCQIRLDKIREEIRRKPDVWAVDLGDRRVFLFPDSSDEQETRMLTTRLLDIAASENVCSICYTNFSMVTGNFPSEKIGWVLETMLAYEVSEGPFMIWFEIANGYLQPLRQLTHEIDGQ
jgi:hypothetical protein